MPEFRIKYNTTVRVGIVKQRASDFISQLRCIRNFRQDL